MYDLNSHLLAFSHMDSSLSRKVECEMEFGLSFKLSLNSRVSVFLEIIRLDTLVSNYKIRHSIFLESIIQNLHNGRYH
jgi:hypothetical protein